MIFPKAFSDLIESLKKLPGIGEKTAERLAFAILDYTEEDAKEFSDNILNVKKNIHNCSICGSLTDQDICMICSDKTRNSEEIIVVEDPKDVFILEKIGNFNSYFHVLGGLISPIDDISPEDIRIKELITRVSDGNIKEVILATKTSIESDMTALYISKLLSTKDVKVTRIASGIPIGADMDYVDSLTLESALKNRKEIKNNID